MSIEPINKSNVLEILRNSPADRPAVSDTTIIALCTTIPIGTHLHALVIIKKCANRFTAFLCWLFFPSYRRDFELYRATFPNLSKVTEPSPSKVVSNASKKPVTKNYGDLFLSTEDLNNDKEVLRRLFEFIPPDFDTCDDNQQKEWFGKTCKVAYEIVRRRRNDKIYTSAFEFHKKNSENISSAVRSQCDLMHRANVELLNLLKGIFENLKSNGQRMNFLSTTMSFNTSQVPCPANGLMAATFLNANRKIPENFWHKFLPGFRSCCGIKS
jgi:hypothetical protein